MPVLLTLPNLNTSLSNVLPLQCSLSVISSRLVSETLYNICLRHHTKSAIIVYSYEGEPSIINFSRIHIWEIRQ